MVQTCRVSLAMALSLSLILLLPAEPPNLKGTLDHHHHHFPPTAVLLRSPTLTANNSIRPRNSLLSQEPLLPRRQSLLDTDLSPPLEDVDVRETSFDARLQGQ